MSNENRLPLRERNKQRNLQRIIDAAFDLFQTVGYHQTTMEAIADRAEVSRATLFNYIPTKQKLLMLLTNKLYQECVQPEIRSYLEAQPATSQALHSLFMSIYKHILTFPDLYRALQEEFFHREPGSREDPGTGFFETLLMILQYGKLRGEVRADIPLEKMVHYIGVLYVSLLFHPLEMQDEQVMSMNYRTEIDTLLVFLKAVLNNHVVQSPERKEI